MSQKLDDDRPVLRTPCVVCWGRIYKGDEARMPNGISFRHAWCLPKKAPSDISDDNRPAIDSAAPRRGEWNDANKTKPPEGREVLVVLKLVGCEEIFYHLATWDGNHWVSDSMYRLAGVYAWMPLPTPPPF